MTTPTIIDAAAEHLQDVRQLAEEIWYDHYPGIITHKQIAYMLESGYALDVLERDLERGVRYALLMLGGVPAGFAGYEPSPNADRTFPDEDGIEAKLHKLYLRTSFHGRGMGSTLLQYVEDQCRAGNVEVLGLTVNKHNLKAIRAYERNGFARIRCIFKDIGNGFFMDDYVMAKRLNRATG